MVGTIGPMVYGRTVFKRYTLLAVYTAAHMVGALAVGVPVALIGIAMPDSLLARNSSTFAACCLLLSLREWGVIRLPLPQSKRQVPKRWRCWPTLGILMYGGVLGAGIGTRITTASYYALLVGVMLSRDWRDAAIAMATFGLARAVPICILATMQFEDAARYAAAVMDVRELIHVANGALLLSLGVVCEPWFTAR